MTLARSFALFVVCLKMANKKNNILWRGEGGGEIFAHRYKYNVEISFISLRLSNNSEFRVYNLFVDIQHTLDALAHKTIRSYLELLYNKVVIYNVAVHIQVLFMSSIYCLAGYIVWCLHVNRNHLNLKQILSNNFICCCQNFAQLFEVSLSSGKG
jgi:hypothetical protein